MGRPLAGKARFLLGCGRNDCFFHEKEKESLEYEASSKWRR
jgi:hypothetical protein